MNCIKLSIRVPAAQEIMLRHIASVRGLSRYQALSRVIEIGINAIMHPVGAVPVGPDLGDFSARLSTLEALTDRSLFTASAAYTYARRAALKGDSDAERIDAQLADAVRDAYQRQRCLAAESLS